MSSLPQISRRAVANAQSLLRFEKDRPAVYRDAQHDRRELEDAGPAGRLKDVTNLLLRATEMASADDFSPAAKASVSFLCDWVEEELAWHRALV